MDEPTSGVSSQEKFRIMTFGERSRRAGRHLRLRADMEMVERYADRVAVWSAGQIQSVGPPDQVLTDPAVMRDVIGV